MDDAHGGAAQIADLTAQYELKIARLEVQAKAATKLEDELDTVKQQLIDKHHVNENNTGL
jgi:hypothetical protein